jgi:hypothetical protein
VSQMLATRLGLRSSQVSTVIDYCNPAEPKSRRALSAATLSDLFLSGWISRLNGTVVPSIEERLQNSTVSSPFTVYFAPAIWSAKGVVVQRVRSACDDTCRSCVGDGPMQCTSCYNGNLLVGVGGIGVCSSDGSMPSNVNRTSQATVSRSSDRAGAALGGTLAGLLAIVVVVLVVRWVKTRNRQRLVIEPVRNLNSATAELRQPSLSSFVDVQALANRDEQPEVQTSPNERSLENAQVNHDATENLKFTETTQQPPAHRQKLFGNRVARRRKLSTHSSVSSGLSTSQNVDSEAVVNAIVANAAAIASAKGMKRDKPTSPSRRRLGRHLRRKRLVSNSRRRSVKRVGKVLGSTGHIHASRVSSDESELQRYATASNSTPGRRWSIHSSHLRDSAPGTHHTRRLELIGKVGFDVSLCSF